MSVQTSQLYYVIGLKSDEVARGALTQVADLIRNAFMTTGEAVRKGELRGAQEKWAIIKFDASDMLGMGELDGKYEELGYDTVLYLNDVAWGIIHASGLKLELIEKISELPKGELGTYISMPHWE